MEHQDWDTVVFDKRRGRRAPADKAATLERARREGGTVSERKFAGGTNKSVYSSGAGAGARKLEEETEDFTRPTVGLDLARAIQQARTAKGMKQKELATRINEKATVINLYEAGKAVPNGAIIAKIERALGVRLPRPAKKKASKK